MKKLLLWMSLFLFISWAAQATSINIDNESFSVELVAQPICGTLQESIFHLQRENYTTESQAIAFNYTTTCNDKAIIVNKEIKKYTESKTGSCNFVKSGNYSITFTYLNKTEEWVLPVICEQEEKENISAQPICFEEFSLNLNKRVFEKGEQLLMDFSINPIPDSLEITYWIETLNGSSIKGKRTTTNIDTKKHTFQTIQVPEQGAFVHAIANDNCSKQEREELILLKGTAEEKVDEQTEPSLDIIKVEQQEDLLEAEILAYRGNSKSSVITIDLKNQQGKIISSEKIKLEKKESKVTITTLLPILQEEQAILSVEGLGLSANKTILLEQKESSLDIINTYTKQKYFTDTLSWYVRTRQENPLVIEVSTGNHTSKEMVFEAGEKTTILEIPYEGGAIITSITDGTDTKKVTTIPNVTSTKTQKKTVPQKEVLLTLENSTRKSIVPEMVLTNDSKEPAKIDKTIFERKSLYLLFGGVLAGSAYLLLKEQ